MYPIYSSLLFLAILGSFMTFIWMVKQSVDQTQWQLTLEPQWIKNKNWNSVGRLILPSNRLGNDDVSRYYNSNLSEEEQRLMREIDNIENENELKNWFEMLKEGYKHKNIPKKVYLRVSTILNGYVWFDKEEYTQRVQAGKPVHKVTKREYALEKKLDSLTNNLSE